MKELNRFKLNKIFILAIITVIYILFYRFIILNYFLKYNEIFTGVFSILLFVLSFIFFGYRRQINNDKNKLVVKSIIVNIVVFFVTLFFIGLITGFLKNGYSTDIVSIINNSFMLLITYVCIEVIRYNVISYNKKNKINILLITLLIIIFEINLQLRIDMIIDIESVFIFLTKTIIPIVLNNLLLTYIVINTNNIKGNLIYSLILNLYVYILPVVPDLNDYIYSVLFIILPFTTYFSINMSNDDKVKNNNKKLDIIMIISLIILAILIFGVGPFKMIGIETGSMQPNINRGDVVLINKYIDKSELKENDIIAYYNDKNELIIHRIIKINSDDTLIMKGDYNNTADSKYVSKDKVYGKVFLKIPFLAYPALIFRQK